MSGQNAVGMNLAGVNYWSTEHPFIDRMKTGGTWNAPGIDSSLIKTDALGYPTSIPAGTTGVYTMIALDPAALGHDNVYVLTYNGTATFKIPGTKILSSEPGKIVFEYSGTGQQGIVVTSLDAAAPLTNMHVVQQSQQRLFEQGEIFNPAFVEKISAFDTLRYMGWGNTNDSTASSWSARTTIDSRSWATTGKDASVPIEVMVALANKTHTNMWVNIPAQADDNYVRQMMTYVRDNLDASLKVNLEYSNEVWNWGYSQSKYAAAQANKLWGKDVNGDSVIDPNNPLEAVSAGWVQYYGYRSAQVAAIANNVFGSAASTRLETVISTQTGNQGLEKSIFQGVERAGLGAAGTLFDKYAVTTYFGGELSGATAADRAKILSWARSGEAGVAAAFDELVNGGHLTGGDFLASYVQIFAYQAAVAKQYGLDLVSYEGGISFGAGNFSAADRPVVLDFLNKLQADPRMGEVYTQALAIFTAAGGTLNTFLADAAADRPAGNFGTLKSIYDNPTPAWLALVAAQQAAESAAASGSTIDDSSARISNSNYTLLATDRNVTYVGSAHFAATGNAFDNVITGGAAGNRLFGGAGADLLIGGDSADWLEGGIGADIMKGKGGDDIYVVDSADDVIIEAANEGIDEVRVTLATYTLGGNLENLTFTGSTRFVGVGNDAANVIAGGNGGNNLSGGGGNDTLVGGTGNDLLDGGTGNDAMTGGLGNDVYIVDSSGDVANELANGGTDEVRTTLASYALGANLENLSYAGSSFFTGTGNALNNVLVAGNAGSQLFGGDGADTLTGGDGIDYLDGGTGADRLAGGAGDDIYLIDNVGDSVVEAANGGVDQVRTTLNSYNLTSNVENLSYTGTGTFSASGNALNNVIIGGGGADKLYGNGGNDTLIGGAGNDTLDGGTGADTMTGGAGDDNYFVDQANDVVIESADGGTDMVVANVSYLLGTAVENLKLIGTGAIDGTGNELANFITGNAAANRLSGGAGSDTISGGDGNDTINGDDGNDSLFGDAGNDIISGGNADDLLSGGAGDDILIGGAGADGLTGGLGADRFVFRPGDLGTASGASVIDRIFDFNRIEGDKIDLSAFDADTGTAAKDPFVFIGSAAFSKRAGELRVDNSGYYALISADLDGDGVADFTLNVARSTGALMKSDLIL